MNSSDTSYFDDARLWLLSVVETGQVVMSAVSNVAVVVCYTVFMLLRL